MADLRGQKKSANPRTLSAAPLVPSVKPCSTPPRTPVPTVARDWSQAQEVALRTAPDLPPGGSSASPSPRRAQPGLCSTDQPVRTDVRTRLSVVPDLVGLDPVGPDLALSAPGCPPSPLERPSEVRLEPTGGPAADLRAEAAFDDILRRATPRLVRFAQRRLGNLHEAEEVAQEALLRTFQNRHKLATEDDVMAWATFATSRLVIDRVRVRGRSISMAEVPDGRHASPDTADIALARAETRIALDALDSLPGRQASVLWAREVEGLRYDEIGDRFGLSEPTVRSLLHRGRKALRRAYTVRGGTIPVGGVAILGPWLWPVKHAHRLRNAAVTLVGTTALGVLGLSLFALSIPRVSAPSVPSPESAVVRIATGATRTVFPGAAEHVAPRPAVPSASAMPPTTGRAASATAAMVCTGRQVGVNCQPDTTANRLWIHLPGTTIGAYVGTDDAPCTMLPTSPVAGCDRTPQVTTTAVPSGVLR